MDLLQSWISWSRRHLTPVISSQGLLDLPMEPRRMLVISWGHLPQGTDGSSEQHSCTSGIQQGDKVGFEGMQNHHNNLTPQTWQGRLS